MSTMLKTAAMTLLSKTLQTFLYKYISDVDVEGVALPSLYDGASSGWGVRLCNVKLREGVELMQTLPGTVPKKRKRKRKKTSSSSQPPKTTKAKKATPAKTNQDGGDDRREEQQDIAPSTPQTKRSGQQKERSLDKKFTTTLNDITTTTATTRATTELEPIKLGTKKASFAYEKDEEDDLSLELQQVLKATYYSTDEEDDGRPATPVQDSKSLLACFYNASGRKVASAKNSKQQDGETEKYSSLHKLPSTGSLQGAKNHAPKGQDHIIIISDSSHGTNDKSSATTHGISLEDQLSSAPGETKIQTQQYKTIISGETPEHDEEEEEEEEEEYEEEYDQPMCLRLGDGGRIGTLDVRLVGKELHILVEDAFLTVEVVPIVQTEKEENDDESHGTSTEENGPDQAATGVDGGTATAKSTKKADSKIDPPPKSAKTKLPETPRATVGERVMAENFIARAIAAIPHLFLRDIRIRLIVRDEAPPPTNDTTAAAAEEPEEKKVELETSAPGANDTLVEFAVNFLSVTSGEDVLSHFQPAEDDDSTDDTAAEGGSHAASHANSRSTPRAKNSKTPMGSIPSFSSVDSTMEQNEFLIRHIRTGRGPEGGIWVKIFTPQEHRMPQHREDDHSPTWARYCWLMATEYHFFRCSGVDIRARIHLGTKKEVARSAWFYDDFDDDEDDEDFMGYDENTLDSMLWSVDYVAPGPQLPFPPVSPHMSRGDTPTRDRRHSFDKSLDSPSSVDNDSHSAALLNQYDGADIFFKDRNGIQSCKVPSNFHRVGRGMTPGSCKECEHLPCDTCSGCWDQPPDGSGTTEGNSLDASLPMPGLILQITMREPLEINADRASLESVGLLRSIFTKKQELHGSNGESSEEDEAKRATSSEAAAETAASESATPTTAASSTTRSRFFGGFLSRPINKEPVKQDPTDAFPAYMQPEYVQVIGLHLSKIVFRIHMMKKRPEVDSGLSFCYWNMVTRCVNLDYQALLEPSSPHPVPEQKSFQDIRFDIGHLDLTEFKGLNRTKLMLLGLRHKEQSRNRCDSSASTVSLDRDDEPDAPWPSMAFVLLDLPPPLETIIYKSRQRHGVQLRFLSVDTSGSTHQREMYHSKRSQVHLRLGPTSMTMPWEKKNEIATASSEAMICLFDETSDRDHSDQASSEKNINDETNPTAENEEHLQASKKLDSVMSYKVQIDGGIMKVPPLMNVRMPLTQFSGERSPESGMFMETVLEHFQFSYGEHHPSSTSSGQKRISLLQLATLPENVRLRILLFLEDLGPLEEALQVKKETNHFMRYRSVNKGIVDMAKTIVKSRSSLSGRNLTTVSGESTSSRRQDLMTELLKLDDDELDELLATYRKSVKKNVSRQSRMLARR